VILVLREIIFFRKRNSKKKKKRYTDKENIGMKTSENVTTESVETGRKLALVTSKPTQKKKAT
jgi:hypothetical protein